MGSEALDLRMPIEGDATPVDPYGYQHTAGDKIPTSGWDALKATVDEQAQNTPVASWFGEGAVGRYIDQKRIEARDSEILPKEELNRLYPNVEKKFEGPASRETGAYLDFLGQEKRRLAYEIENGPQGAFYGAAKFAAGILPHAMDPLNLVTAGVGGVAAKGLGLARGAIATRAAGLAVEGAVAGGLSEIPVYLQNQNEQQKYTLGDSFENIAMTAATVPIFHAIGHFSKPVFEPINHVLERSFARFEERYPRAVEVMRRVGLAQAESGRKINVDPLVKDTATETMPPEGGAPVSEFSPERPVFAATERAVDHITEAPAAQIGDEFGKNVVTLSTDATEANNHAARKLNETDGTVFKAEVKDAKILDLNKELPEDVLGKMKGLLGEDFNAGDHATGKELFDDVRQAIDQGYFHPEKIDEINSAMKELGYDGYHYQSSNVMGQEGKPRSLVVMLDPERTGDAGGKIVQTDSTSPNPDLVPHASAEAAAELSKHEHSPENYWNADPQLDAEIEKLKNESHPEITEADVRKEIDGLKEQVQGLDEQGLLSESDKAQLEQYKETEKETGLIESMYRAAVICIRGQG